jgi:glycosyltransferase involved in cell wall biosynthesis
LALTSHNEASPVSLLEALSCSVPAVATNVGSVAETILPGKTGELFSAGDLDSFVAKSLALLQNKSATLALGKAGRKLVEEKYSLGSMIGGYEALLEKLVAAKTRTRQPSRSATAPRVVAKE